MSKISDFIIKPNILTVLFLEPYNPKLTALKDKMSTSEAVNALECTSIQEALPVLKQLKAFIVMCSATHQDHLVKHITMMRLLTAQIKAGNCKVLILSNMQRNVVDPILMKNGCSEVLDEKAHEKAFQHKIQRYVTLLQPKLKDVAQAQNEKQSVKKTTTQSAQQQEARKAKTQDSGGKVQKVAPLKIQSDCWLLHSVGSVKKIRGQWLMKLIGPSPTAGKWIDRGRAAGQTDANESSWEWVPTVQNDDAGKPIPDAFILEAGMWQFLGQRPFFAEKIWNFTARKPSLVFIKDQERLGLKATVVDSGDLWIAEDSAQGKKLIPAIAKTLEIRSKFSQKKEEERKINSKLKGASDGQGSKGDSSVIWEGPISLKGDCWVLFEGKEPKRISGRWLSKFHGPAPSVGKWVEAKGPTQERWWKWEPLDPKTYPFTREKGAWLYKGFEPKFQDNIWVFVGARPELAFYEDVKSLGARLFTDGAKKVHIAKDSQAATDFIPLLQETLEQVIKAMGGKAGVAENVKDKKQGAGLSDEELIDALEKEGKGDGEDVDADEDDPFRADSDESVERKRGEEVDSVDELSEDDADHSETESGETRKKKKKRKDAESEAEAVEGIETADDAEGTDLEITAEHNPGREMAGNISGDGPGNEMSGEISADDPGREMAGNIGGDEQGKGVSGIISTDAAPAGEVNDRRTAEAAASGDAPSITEEAVVSKELYLKDTPLEPLFFAFLMSELLASRELNTQQVTEKFLIALSHALQGRQVELWSKECLGKFPDRPSEPSIKDVDPAFKFSVSTKSGEEIAALWVAPPTEEQSKTRDSAQDQEKLKKIARTALGLALSTGSQSG